MKQLTGLQALATQNFNTLSYAGETIYINLYFRPAVQMWFMDIESGDFILKGQRVCNLPNLLQQYRRIISFGINVTVSDGGEPFQINDFQTGRVTMSILSSAEVEQIVEAYQTAKDSLFEFDLDLVSRDYAYYTFDNGDLMIYDDGAIMTDDGKGD